MSETVNPTPTAAASPVAPSGDLVNLLPHHREMLTKSAISADVVRERGYRSVEKKIELKTLGFASYQLRVPTLLVPIRNVHGEIATYQSRPDEPRVAKDRDKPIKYETVAEGRLVLDVPMRTRAVVATPKVPLWITEGAKKVDSLVTLGLSAIGVLGVWAWRGTNDQGGKTALADLEFIAWNDRRVYLVFDSDTWTKIGVYSALVRLKNLLESRGAKVQVVYLPACGDGAKTGVDDYVAEGHGVDDLLALASDELRRPPSVEGDDKPYVVRPDGIWWMKTTEAGDLAPVQLTNFNAKITAQVVEDDGAYEKKVFEIEASRGARTTTFKVAPAEFTKMEWPIEQIGSEAWVAPGGRAMRERAHVAIQELSGPARERRVFTHTGWRRIADRWTFLHAGGALDQDGVVADVDVGLPPQLAAIELPPPPSRERLVLCWSAVKRFLEVGPQRITYPLLGYVGRTVLAPIDCAVHLEGESGVFKSEIAALVQQFFGCRMNARSFPGSWSSTANALERLAFQAKDVVIVVDDFVPRGSAQDVQRAHRDAERLLRGQGNHAGRSRMGADSSLRPTYFPRGGILSTGEDVPAGQSLLARLLVLHVGREDIDAAKLQTCQSDGTAGLYAEFMAALVSWLASRRDECVEDMKTDVPVLRGKAADGAAHRRTPEIVANFAFGIGLVVRFLLDKGLVSEAEAEVITDAGWLALGDAAAAHGRQQRPTAPHTRFIALIGALVASGRAHLASTAGGAPSDSKRWGWRTEQVANDIVERPQGDRIGYIDGDNVYLVPDAAYALAQRMAASGGDALAVSLQTLQKRLNENGFLASRDEARETLTVRRTLEGRQQKVLHLRATVLGADSGLPLGGVADDEEA